MYAPNGLRPECFRFLFRKQAIRLDPERLTLLGVLSFVHLESEFMSTPAPVEEMDLFGRIIPFNQ